MDRIRSLHDLEQARIEAVNEEKVAAQQCPFEIRVGLGSCGIAAGANETWKAIHEFIDSNRLTGIKTRMIGCIGLCAVEPIVQVVEAGHAPVTYGRVIPAVVKRIFKEHIEQDIIVQEYVVENI